MLCLLEWLFLWFILRWCQCLSQYSVEWVGFCRGGVRLSPLGTSVIIWSIATAPDDGWWWVWSRRWNEWQGKPKSSGKTCPSATLSTKNSTWPDPGSNPGRQLLRSQRLNSLAMARRLDGLWIIIIIEKLKGTGCDLVEVLARPSFAWRVWGRSR
jgi:hypothetical protein